MSNELIRAERCMLRPHSVDDIGAYLQFWTEQADDVPGGPPQSAEAAWMRLLFFIGHWRQFGFAMFLVLDAESEMIIGEVGYRYIPRPLGGKFGKFPEAAWNLGKEARGKGIGSQALCAATEWMDRHHQGPSVCFIDPENKTSVRLAEKVGFQRFGNGQYHEMNVDLFERV